MGRVRCKVVWVVTLVLLSVEAQALPFISLDARANAMGGAGVAAARGSNVAFINPALLRPAQRQWDATAVGLVRFADPRNLQEEIDIYQRNKIESIFETALLDYKADPSTSTPRANIATATQNIIAQLNRFSGRPIEEEVSIGFAAVLPEKKMALLVGQQTIGGARLINVDKDLALFTGVIDGLNNPDKLPDDEVFNIILSGPGRNVNTKLRSQGALIREFGLALAREVEVGGRKVDVGITPKYVDVTTFDSEQLLPGSSYNSAAGQRHYASYNVDLGLAVDHGDGWRGGVAIKNLIPHRYRTVLDGAVKIEPQARIGAAYSGEWYAAALDLDLNESKGVGLASDSQYLSIGAELSLIKSLQLRGGYRHNISNTKTNMVTLGVGFGVLGAAADIGMSLNKDGVGLSGQLGFHF